VPFTEPILGRNKPNPSHKIKRIRFLDLTPLKCMNVALHMGYV